MSAVIYLQIKATLIVARNLSNSASFQDIPQIAIQMVGKRPRIIAYGKQAGLYSHSPETRLLNAFQHPRSLLNDFEAAEKTLRFFLAQVDHRKLRLWPLLPKELIIHPLEQLEGGLTQIEKRAWIDLGYRIFAQKVLVWTGPLLSDIEICSHQFPIGGTLYEG